MDATNNSQVASPTDEPSSTPDEEKRWWSNNDEDLLSLIENHYQEDQRNKLSLVKLWEENIRFIEGDQYIKYNKILHAYEPIPDRIDREYIPRANDNQLYIRADIARANLTRQGPIFNITANSNDPKDERGAKVALAVHQAREELDKDKRKRAEMADWNVCTGNGFLAVEWCPTSSVPAINPDGTPILDEESRAILAPIGDVRTRTVSPLCMAPDREATGEEDLKVLMEYGYEDLDDVKSWYDQKGNGYTGKAHELVSEDAETSNNALKTNEALKDLRNQEKKPIDHSVILKRIYVRPDEYKLPYGRIIIEANGVILYINDSPYARQDPRTWHPYHHTRYKSQPGRYWGLTPVTQGVKLQRRLNAIDTMCILNRQTVAMGQWLVPKNTVKNGAFSGRVGLKIEYKTGPRGEKPEKIPGTPVGQDIFEERQQVIAGMDALFGTSDMQKPNSDLSSMTGIAMELVREHQFSRFNPLYEDWEMALEAAAQLRLTLICNNQDQDIPEFTAIIRRKLRSLTALDVTTFTKESMVNNTNINIVAGSTIPKSNASKLAYLEKFGEAGLLGDLVKDPYKNQLFLSEFGIENFKTLDNVDFENAKYQLGLIESNLANHVIISQLDNNNLHVQYLTSKVLDPSWYTSRPTQVVQGVTQLIMKRKQIIDQQKKQATSEQRQQRDEGAYVQALVDRGGPDGNAPALNMFPSAMENSYNEEQKKVNDRKQLEQQAQQQYTELLARLLQQHGVQVPTMNAGNPTQGAPQAQPTMQ